MNGHRWGRGARVAVACLVALTVACGVGQPGVGNGDQDAPATVRASPVAADASAVPSSTLSQPAPAPRSIAPAADNPNPPTSPVKLVFIHHSCGDSWLNAGEGDLGNQLGANNYYVSDTYYDWGPDEIGSYTDIGNWWDWFRGPDSTAYTQAVYDTSNHHADYARPMADPGGENEIIMFKSCYPNSHLGGNQDDPPPADPNPLCGEDYTSEHHTVGNAKGIYNDILECFSTRQDKLFVVITAPPLVANERAQVRHTGTFPRETGARARSP